MKESQSAESVAVDESFSLVTADRLSRRARASMRVCDVGEESCKRVR
jgi:hypothetical protein